MAKRDDLWRIEQAILHITRVGGSREAARVRSERSGVYLSRPAIAMLASLRVTGAMRPSVLARRTGLEAPLVSRELRALVAHGYARRAPDPTDGRAGIVDLTAKGRRAADAYRAATDDLAAEAFEAWTAADLRALATLLERVAVDITGRRSQPVSSGGRL